LTGGPTIGQLKTSLSHLEYENQQLKRKVASLDDENRVMEDRLAQEQIDNGDLAARLDDARNLLRDRGLDPDMRVGARRSSEEPGDAEALGADRRGNDSPSGTPGRPRRKTPFAQISGSLDKHPQIEDDEQESAPRSARPGTSRRRAGDTLDHHSFFRGRSPWLPVVDATDASTIQIR
jgi:hypothetical protein